ncbi:putative glutaminase [Diaporthe ampelina]|uniref:Putative glutaminase n=1 Tax=Diaporthe ampelina TaxID=1214573 RepID=A0A0G2FZU9_9PEZI|nr:putative glutaminase [Diaporthe ampelina]
MASRLFPGYVFVVLAAILLTSGLAQQQHAVPRHRRGVDDNNNNNNPLPSYSPARPPAVPLAVRSPYLSAWSKTAGGATLNSANAIFWQGDAIGWEGIVTVDGISYEYLGSGAQCPPTPAELQSAKPQTVSYDSQYSNFTFTAGPVTIEASFFSPVTPEDICRSSIPLSYLTTSVKSNDCEGHSVQFYSDINAAWATPDRDIPLVWDLKADGQDHRMHPPAAGAGARDATDPASTIFTWVYGLEDAYMLGEDAEFPQWGNITYSTSSAGSRLFSFESGVAADVRARFVKQRVLNDSVDRGYRGWGVREPVFAFAHDAGSVTSAQVRYTIGSIQTPVVRYLSAAGSSPLSPWWEKCYGDMYSMISFHWHDFGAVSQLGATFEARLRADVGAYYRESENSTSHAWMNGSSPPPASSVGLNVSGDYADGAGRHGQEYKFDPDNAYGFLAMDNSSGVAIPDIDEAEAYYSIVALSARQVMGAYVYAMPPSGAAGCGEGPRDSDDAAPLMFQKEISSDGNINTVDVLFPATPFFLWANPEMLKYTLEPMFQNTESGFYPNGYAMHDLGAHYPNATGHTDGIDEFMPVEESGNMLLMSYAYYKFSGDAAWLGAHYATLKRWAEFLVGSSLTPASQLSTDDFAGRLANQTNLALKGIIALQAMGAAAEAVGQAGDAAGFSGAAGDYYRRWEALAVDPSGRHTLLSYQWRSSWGLLYNSYMDRLLGLGAVRPGLYRMQSDWYARQSQVFGVPLDSRHLYTKSDWEMWTAATCAPGARRLFVNALAHWLNSTPTEFPLTDLYDTVAGGGYPPGLVFKARPVVGGHFALLALHRASAGLLGDSNRSVLGPGVALRT